MSIMLLEIINGCDLIKSYSLSKQEYFPFFSSIRKVISNLVAVSGRFRKYNLEGGIKIFKGV